MAGGISSKLLPQTYTCTCTCTCIWNIEDKIFVPNKKIHVKWNRKYKNFLAKTYFAEYPVNISWQFHRKAKLPFKFIWGHAKYDPVTGHLNSVSDGNLGLELRNITSHPIEKNNINQILKTLNF